MKVLGYDRLVKEYSNCPKEFPDILLSEDWAYKEHSQSLAMLDRRGGMCPSELIANIFKLRHDDVVGRFDQGKCITMLAGRINENLKAAQSPVLPDIPTSFWETMKSTYSVAYGIFSDWVDVYKVRTGWNEVVGNKIKIHNMPYDVQLGIWFRFLVECIGTGSWMEVYIDEYDLKHGIEKAFILLENHANNLKEYTDKIL